MTVGYSGKALIDKLGIKSGQLVYFKNAPEEYFKELGKIPEGVFVAKKLNRPVDFMHCFYTEAKELKKDTLNFKQYLEQNGTLWVSWPKKASKTKTDITEQTLRDVLLPFNLVDIKVAAVTDIWSGLKFVWRKR
jgi:hypothetical protein